MHRITLLTDFGTADGYVAAMKGAIAQVAPETIIDDAAHDIPPGDVEAAAFTLARYWRLYPPGTVHVVVVDPGVGTERRTIAARVDGRFFVAPDNGVLSHVLDEARAEAIHAIENPALRRDVVSATFHGRDIFAPAAAHLAHGTPLDAFGPAIDDPVVLPIPRPERSGREIRGHVVAVDRFGNLITNVPGAWLSPRARVAMAGRDVGPLRRTYADAPPGGLLALVGSTGMLEISVRDGSAAMTLDATRGAGVTIWEEDGHGER